MRRRPPYHSLQCRHLPPDACATGTRRRRGASTRREDAETDQFHGALVAREPAAAGDCLESHRLAAFAGCHLCGNHIESGAPSRTRPCWHRRAVMNRRLHAVEQCRVDGVESTTPAVAETRRENLIYAQVVLLPAPPSRQLWPSRVGPEGRTAWERRCLQSYASPMPLLGRWAARLRQSTICMQ